MAIVMTYRCLCCFFKERERREYLNIFKKVQYIKNNIFKYTVITDFTLDYLYNSPG